MHVTPFNNLLLTEIDENNVAETLTRMDHKLVPSSFLTFTAMSALDDCANSHIIRDTSLFVGEIAIYQPSHGVNAVVGSPSP